jgi:deazaflavin-dependent oxidoreductase (nitroreductase family)
MAYRDVMRWFGHQSWFQFTAAKLAPIDAKVLKRTGGRFGLLGNYGLPQCLLTTTGRKSGQQRTVTLLYGTKGDEIIMVGSNFGQKHQPAWALNMEADPDVVVEIEGKAVPMKARMISDDVEREEAWQIMYQLWPAYNAYRGKAGRAIKVFALSPA